MYIWKNNKIKNQYDLQMMTAKNRGLGSYTPEELSVTTLKTKNFNDVHDAKMKRLLELAYIRGRLDGIRTADEQLDDIPFGKKVSQEILKQPANAPERSVEQFYYVVCKVSNAQNKIVYVGHGFKAHSESEALSNAAANCDQRKQTVIKSSVVRIYGPDTMQFEFGVGTKEETTLLDLGKKMLAKS